MSNSDFNFNQLFTEIFYPETENLRQKYFESDKQFVHYTSVNAAINIISKNQVWLRHTSVMNDLMENKQGWVLFEESYKKHATVFEKMYKILMPGNETNLDNELQSLIKSAMDNTYVASFSEHLKEENGIGRLSMWRAYGKGVTPLALVLRKSKMFYDGHEDTLVFTPVNYLTKNDFEKKFDEMITRLEKKLHLIKPENKQNVFNNLVIYFIYLITTTKHHGFKEEKEWRLIHISKLFPLNFIQEEIEVIDGTPQIICKFSTKELPESISMNDLIEQIIIGPCLHPKVVKESLVKLLNENGIENANNKVKLSDIPLRT